MSDMFHTLLQDEALDDLLPLVFEFLQSYNSRSPYRQIQNWDKVREERNDKPIPLTVTGDHDRRSRVAREIEEMRGSFTAQYTMSINELNDNE